MTNSAFKSGTVIIGMGHTGLSCARFLARHGLDFAMTDSRQDPPMLETLQQEFSNSLLLTGALDEGLVLHAREVVLSPGVSPTQPILQKARLAGIDIIGDIELFCRHVKAPVIAITGSNGKSTVTTLVASLASSGGLKTAVGGNLGTPALALLDDSVELYVLELSSFQLETVRSLNAMAAVVLNISDDHMDRYENLAAYCLAKNNIYMGDGLMVLNRDDKAVMSMFKIGRNAVTFGLDEPTGNNFGIHAEGNRRWLVRGKDKIIATDELQVSGDHNLLNLLAALALCHDLEITSANVHLILHSFTGLPHRCQLVLENEGIRWINDSKGTNIGATCAAIEGLARDRNIILIAGGDGKGADFSQLATVAQQHLHAAILIGRDAPLIRKVFINHITTLEAVGMTEAVQAAAELARPGDIVLLSPACASQDMFADYRERGEVFTRAVLNAVKDHV